MGWLTENNFSGCARIFRLLALVPRTAWGLFIGTGVALFHEYELCVGFFFFCKRSAFQSSPRCSLWPPCTPPPLLFPLPWPHSWPFVPPSTLLGLCGPGAQIFLFLSVRWKKPGPVLTKTTATCRLRPETLQPSEEWSEDTRGRRLPMGGPHAGFSTFAECSEIKRLVLICKRVGKVHLPGTLRLGLGSHWYDPTSIQLAWTTLR